MTETYDDDQLARAVELWRRIIAADCARLERSGWYEKYPQASGVDDDELTELIAHDGEATEDVDQLEVHLCGYGDYGGATYDAANVRTLSEYPGVQVYDHGVHGTAYAWMQVGEIPADTTVDEWLDWLGTIAGALESLTDYPILDEEAWSAYETELQDEAWDAWLGSDVISTISARYVDAVDWTRSPEHDAEYERRYARLDRFAREPIAAANGEWSWLRVRFYEEIDEWICESATSATPTSYSQEQAIKAIVADWFAGPATVDLGRG